MSQNINHFCWFWSFLSWFLFYINCEGQTQFLLVSQRQLQAHKASFVCLFPCSKLLGWGIVDEAAKQKQKKLKTFFWPSCTAERLCEVLLVSCDRRFVPVFSFETMQTQKHFSRQLRPQFRESQWPKCFHHIRLWTRASAKLFSCQDTTVHLIKDEACPKRDLLRVYHFWPLYFMLILYLASVVSLMQSVR